MAKRVIHSSLGEQVYEVLKESIIRGELRPGERLVELEIAKTHGVSQAPVREALSRLGEEGLVISYRHKGTFVSNFSDKDIEEYYSFREMMEVFAIRRAMERVTPEDITALEQLYAEMLEADSTKDIERMGRTDIAFHTQIYKMADHQFMLQVWDSLSSKASRIWWYLHYEVYFSTLLEVAGIHKPILDAFRDRDVDKCIEAYRDHTDFAKKQIDSRLT